MLISPPARHSQPLVMSGEEEALILINSGTRCIARQGTPSMLRACGLIWLRSRGNSRWFFFFWIRYLLYQLSSRVFFYIFHIHIKTRFLAIQITPRTLYIFQKQNPCRIKVIVANFYITCATVY